MARAVFCIAESESQAESVISNLKSAGFRPEDISVLFSDKSGSFIHEQHTKAPEGAIAGAGAAGVLGGALGWLTGAGLLMIPGFGALLAAGPIMAALSAGAVGAALGGIAGALIGMGIPEYEARRYEGRISGGNILVSVHAADHEAAKRAIGIFELSGAHDISETSEAEVKDEQGYSESERPARAEFWNKPSEGPESTD